MADEAKYQGAYPQLVTKIIASYVSHHNVSPDQIPDLIKWDPLESTCRHASLSIL